MSEEETIPFHRAAVGDEEIAEVIDSIRSGWLTMGPKTRAFEEEFARIIGVKNAVAVSSCTAALHLALDACGVGPGDEVITSAYTFTSTVATILHTGAHPVLADCTPDTLNIDPEEIRRKITERTKVIVPVHFAGHPAPMEEISEIARLHGLVVLEDAAHALPTRYRGRMVGTLSPMTAFSFYATKCITTGEGGMITTDDDTLADRIRVRRLHGMSRDAWRRYSSEGSWRYDVLYPGFKYNMTDLNGALGLVQLRKMDHLREARGTLAALYNRTFRDLAEVAPLDVHDDVEHSWHLYVLRVLETSKVSRDELIEKLKAKGIATSQHFIPIPRFTWYREQLGVRLEDFPVANQAGETTISLPLFPDLSEAGATRVAAAVRGIVRG